MDPKRGANTPVISEHHRKQTSGSPQRIKPELCLSFKTKDQLENRGEREVRCGTKVQQLPAVLHCAEKQLARFYARPPCVLRLEECVEVCSDNPPSLLRGYGRGVCASFLPLGAHCKKHTQNAHVYKVCWSTVELDWRGLQIFENKFK